MYVNSSDVGTRTEAVILSALAKAGYTVLMPFGPARYYSAIDSRDGNGIKTAQCKTGRLRAGCIVWMTCSQHQVTHVRTDYRGQVDYFSVWCPDLAEQVYLVPVNDVGIREGIRRLDPAKKLQPTIRWAKDYQVT